MWQIRRAVEKWHNDGISETARAALSYVQNNTKNITRLPPRQRIWNGYYTLGHGRGTPVVDLDWDVLLILDACRFDSFKAVNELPGELSQRQSCASNTSEFVKYNFAGRELHDTIYVNANPTGVHLKEGPVFHNHFSLLDEFMEHPPTVPPETATDIAIEQKNKHPHKRLMVHYLQPHAPFIGEKAEKIYEEIDGYLYPEPLDYKDFDNYGYAIGKDDKFDVETEDIREAYLESLKLVLSSCQRLIDNVTGKIAVTADHGELFNEEVAGRVINGHPSGVKCHNLRTVPWHVMKKEERPTIRADPPRENTHESEEVVEQRLRELGYK